ncbi:MAG: TolC family protein [Thermodesulfobacteriota bacterium]
MRITAACLVAALIVPGAGTAPACAQEVKDSPARVLSLSECLAIALENNRSRPVSRFNVEIAEAQLQQALSSYWPRLDAKAVLTRMDESPNFIFPQTSIGLPGFTLPVPPPVGPLPIPPQTVAVPDQNIKVMDRDNGLYSLSLAYPLYTGGMRPAIVKQAESGLAAAKQEVRRTDLQVAYDVKRFYYGAVLARKLRVIASDALDRMQVTLDLTESLYKGGSTKVKKTDYLRNKTTVEALRSTFAQLKGTERLAMAALTNAMGIPWDAEIDVADSDIPYRPYEGDLRKFVAGAYAFNPDWKALEEGIRAAEGRLDEKRAGHLPRIALVGNLSHIENSYNKGLVTPENVNSWTAGIAMELPIFHGFRTAGEIREARARLEKLRQEKILLQEGIALQVKDVFLRMARSREQRKAMETAARTAEENRDLNERAYREELVETEDVIEAQLIESFMKAGNEKTLYDHAEAQARLELVVGTQIEAVLR